MLLSSGLGSMFDSGTRMFLPGVLSAADAFTLVVYKPQP
jgi:hypothetical protein